MVVIAQDRLFAAGCSGDGSYDRVVSMSQSQDANVVYGVDLGGREIGWEFDGGDNDYFELPEEYQDNMEWEEIIAEFAGWNEKELDYSSAGSPERELASSQYVRKMNLIKATGIKTGHYGYEFAGVLVYVGEAHHTYWGCEPLGELIQPTEEQIASLISFLEFLDGKGMLLKEEFRKPQWLLSASYG